MKTKAFVVIPLLLLAWVAGAQLASGDQPATRAQFAAAFSKVAKGMPADEVSGLLGKPDDVITQTDPNGNDEDPTAEVWGYGTDGHLTFATLGRVCMSKGKVRTVFVRDGVPPDASMFTEPELRKLLRAIDACRENNPLRFIQAVNLLQPLGKEKALAALGEYERVNTPPFLRIPPYDTVLLISRLLFETPAPLSSPGIFEGWPNPPPPKDPKILPLFPFAVVDDIPVNLVYNYNPGESWMIPPGAVDYFRKNGTLRQHLLVPGNDPFPVLPALEKSPQWTIYPTGKDKTGYPLDGNGKYFVQDQLLRLVDTVYRAKRDRDGYIDMGKRAPDQYWEGAMKDIAALHIHWDAGKQMYVFPDGHTLPDNTPTVYKRQIWELPFAKVPSRLIFERRDKDYIVTRFIFPREVSNPVPDSLVTVRTTGRNARQLLQFKIGYSQKRGEIITHFWDREINLNAGESVQAEIAMGGKATASPVFTP